MDVRQQMTLPPTPSADRIPPEIRELVKEYRIELTDGRIFMLRLDRGVLRLEERTAEADCSLRCSAEMLHRFLNGEANLMTALMRGDVRVTGDLEAGKRLYRYLRLATGTGGTA